MKGRRKTLSNGCAWERVEVPDDEALTCGLLGKGVCILPFGHKDACIGQCPLSGKRTSRARGMSFAGMQGYSSRLVLTHVVSIQDEEDVDESDENVFEESQRIEEEDDASAEDVWSAMMQFSDRATVDDEDVAQCTDAPALEAMPLAVCAAVQLLPPGAHGDGEQERLQADNKAFLGELPGDERERAQSVGAKKVEKRSTEDIQGCDGGWQERKRFKSADTDHEGLTRIRAASRIASAQMDELMACLAGKWPELA